MTMNEIRRITAKEGNDRPEGLTWEEKIRGCGNSFRFPIYLSERLMNADLSELELSARSYNCLKRCGYRTVGELVESIECQSDLKQIRNLGRKSAPDIMIQLFLYQYQILRPERRERYLRRVLELNGIKTMSKE